MEARIETDRFPPTVSAPGPCVAAPDERGRTVLADPPCGSTQVTPPRDHGGGIDRAARLFGGAVSDWLDLSTGINPHPYPLIPLPAQSWTALPDDAATATLLTAARAFWGVPSAAAICAAPGTSALIARMPSLLPAAAVRIDAPTYNEHAHAFLRHGWRVVADDDAACTVRVIVHPNNPDGRFHDAPDPGWGLVVIDESFCDVAPQRSLIGLSARPGIVVLKSIGKFWGLAGMRLGFAIGDPALVAALAEALGPWPVSGPALAIGAAVLGDPGWAAATRARLADDAARLDALVFWPLAGGTPLFRLYDAGDARAVQAHLAQARIWTRVFPYSDRWLRLGLPGEQADWSRLAAAVAALR